MTPVQTIRKAVADLIEKAEEIGHGETVSFGNKALEHTVHVEYALRHLTAEHGSQCQCPGCEVLREGT